MLHINKIKHLATQLGLSPAYLHDVADRVDEYVDELLLIDPANPAKPRDVINVTDKLRLVQSRMYRRIFLRRLAPSDFSHGGVPKRHIRSNVDPHIGSNFAFTTDISNFYPSIHHSRVYRLFVDQLACAPDVARLLTRLCTYSNHLALGLTTSPILADQIVGGVDRRISAACAKQRLIYTRFVDDITVSGAHSLDPKASGLPGLITSILNENGFQVRKEKHRHGRLQDGFTITSLRLRHGRVDVSRQYIEELDDQLNDARRIAENLKPLGLYYTYMQLRGRVEFVAWINRHRRRLLMRELRSINWTSVEFNAKTMGLQSSKKKTVPRQQICA
jgi:RNA-directed DNA polymerase